MGKGEGRVASEVENHEGGWPGDEGDVEGCEEGWGGMEDQGRHKA